PHSSAAEIGLNLTVPFCLLQEATMSIPSPEPPAGPVNPHIEKNRDQSAPPRLSLRRVFFGLLAILVLAGLGTTRDLWMPSGILYPTRTESPQGLSWLPFGTTRLRFLEILATGGNTWACVEKPGMAPSAWASFSNVTIGGNPAPQLAVLFSDAQKF